MLDLNNQFPLRLLEASHHTSYDIGKQDLSHKDFNSYINKQYRPSLIVFSFALKTVLSTVLQEDKEKTHFCSVHFIVYVSVHYLDEVNVTLLLRSHTESRNLLTSN